MASFDCYFICNISTENYQNWWMFVEVIASPRRDVFLGHSVASCVTHVCDDVLILWEIFIVHPPARTAGLNVAMNRFIFVLCITVCCMHA